MLSLMRWIIPFAQRSRSAYRRTLEESTEQTENFLNALVGVRARPVTPEVCNLCAQNNPFKASYLFVWNARVYFALQNILDKIYLKYCMLKKIIFYVVKLHVLSFRCKDKINKDVQTNENDTDESSSCEKRAKLSSTLKDKWSTKLSPKVLKNKNTSFIYLSC